MNHFFDAALLALAVYGFVSATLSIARAVHRSMRRLQQLQAPQLEPIGGNFRLSYAEQRKRFDAAIRHERMHIAQSFIASMRLQMPDIQTNSSQIAAHALKLADDLITQNEAKVILIEFPEKKEEEETSDG